MKKERAKIANLSLNCQICVYLKVSNLILRSVHLFFFAFGSPAVQFSSHIIHGNVAHSIGSMCIFSSFDACVKGVSLHVAACRTDDR